MSGAFGLGGLEAFLSIRSFLESLTWVTRLRNLRPASLTFVVTTARNDCSTTQHFSFPQRNKRK
jgi:hypothetical protein